MFLTNPRNITDLTWLVGLLTTHATQLCRDKITHATIIALSQKKLSMQFYIDNDFRTQFGKNYNIIILVYHIHIIIIV